MQKPSSYARSSLINREKENSSLTSNINSFKEAPFLNKFPKQCPEEAPFLLDITAKLANVPRNLNKSFTELAENQPKVNKSQDISRRFAAEKPLKNAKLDDFAEKKFQKPSTTALFPRENAKIARNVDNFSKNTAKTLETEKNACETASFFPQMLENLNLSGNEARKSLNSREISYADAENAKLSRFYAKDILEELISRDKV